MKLHRKNKPIHAYIEENARLDPDKTAIYFYGRSIKYGELVSYIHRTAKFLLEHGVKKGDTVALFMQNSPQFIIGYFAAQKIGAIAAPCNPMFKEWELEYQLNDLNAKVILVADNLMPIVMEVKDKTNIEHTVIVQYQSLVAEEELVDFPEERGEVYEENDEITWLDRIIFSDENEYLSTANIAIEDDVALIMYTSGTMGSPKGAMLTYLNSEFKTNCLIKRFGMKSTDIYLSVMPIFHIAGMVVGMLSPLAAGASIVLLTRFDAKKVLQSIEKYKVTILYTTPLMNIDMMKLKEIETTDFDSLRLNLATSFGVQVTEELSKKWESYTNIPFFEWAYGFTEAHTGNTLMDPNAIKYATNGKPAYETEVKIIDLNDPSIEMPNDEEGEIIIKSPSVFKGYLNKPEATKEALRDGWFYTGDIGKIDKDGYLVFLGRVKEMIKSSGYSVYPEEVEKMLINHPNIEAAAAIGVADEKRGESIKAYIILKDKTLGTKEEDVIAWAREKMAAYKYPRQVEFVDELPKTSTGKLLRRKLKSNA